jgi:hypothetical protein
MELGLLKCGARTRGSPCCLLSKDPYVDHQVLGRRYRTGFAGRCGPDTEVRNEDQPQSLLLGGSARMPGAIVSAQVIPLNVTYVCSGEHIYIEYCSTQDLSDSARCMIAHTDKPPYNGGMIYSYDTRGNLKRLLPTCQQPSAEEIAREKAFEKRVKDTQDAAQKKNLDNMAPIQSFAPPKPTQLQREEAEISGPRPGMPVPVLLMDDGTPREIAR